MPFVHEDSDSFAELIERVADQLNRDRFTVEKDYWVTHALYALQAAGFTVWFKGGTSLSKGFGLIERFSEDLDIKLEHPAIPEPSHWNRTTTAHTQSREAFFADLFVRLANLSPFTATKEPVPNDDGTVRNFNVRLDWPEHLHARDDIVMKDYVLLEIGSTRVTPHVERRISSWVHDELAALGRLNEYEEARPLIRCLHPLVTLIEKLTILAGRAADDDVPADRFIRHYEDAARLADAHLTKRLPEHPDCIDTRKLIDDVKRISRATLTAGGIPAFDIALLTGDRRAALERAHAAIDGFFFGPRLSLDACTSRIRAWIDREVR